MRVNFHPYRTQQNNTSFKSKLPNVRANYDINTLKTDIIPDYWPELARDSFSRYKRYLTDLLEKLNENFDNNVLALSKIKTDGKNVFVFRLYNNTDELVKSAGSADSFFKAKNYLNKQIIIGKNDIGVYYTKFGGNVNNYNTGWNDETEIILNVLSQIVKPQTAEHKAIYNLYNSHGEEDFLKVFREK